MRILAFSDLHCDLVKARHMVIASAMADVVVCAGDFGAKGGEMEETLAILSEIAVPFVMVAGNHDSVQDLEAFCEIRPNAYYLHGTSVEIQGQAFFGLGYEIPFNPWSPWNLSLSEADAEQYLMACPANSILVTHTPPLGHCDLQRDGSNQGSRAIRDTLIRKSLRLHLCGHIHNAWGMQSQINDCIIQNLGPTEYWFDV